MISIMHQLFFFFLTCQHLLKSEHCDCHPDSLFHPHGGGGRDGCESVSQGHSHEFFILADKSAIEKLTLLTRKVTLMSQRELRQVRSGNTACIGLSDDCSLMAPLVTLA